MEDQVKNMNDAFLNAYKLGIEKGIEIGRREMAREFKELFEKRETSKESRQEGGAL